MSVYNKVIDLQKLSAAWQRVRRNKPAAGVDNVTWQQFDENSREELKQLQIELREHRYEPLPVRNVTLYKGEKARVIALYSMRDRLQARSEHFSASLRTMHVPQSIVEAQETSRTVKGRESPNFTLKITERTPLLMLEAFAGRDDIFSVENVVGSSKRRTELQERPLTEQQIEEHLRGEKTVGTYVQRPNATVRFIVWDIDISKQFILKYGNAGGEFDACLQNAYHKALEIQKILEDKGMHAYIEFSGFRGYHVWLFLHEWIPVRFANMFTDRIEEEIVMDDDLTVECFPNKVRLKTGRFGQVLKIPYGLHVRSGRRSCFIDDEGEQITDIDGFADTLAHYSLAAIRKALSYSMQTASQTASQTPSQNVSRDAPLEEAKTGNFEPPNQDTSGTALQGGKHTEKPGAEGEVDAKGKKEEMGPGTISTRNNVGEASAGYSLHETRYARAMTAEGNLSLETQKELQEAFGNMNASIQEVLFRCSLMQYLCLKSRRTGYLTHFERLSVLYVFGHIGEEGKEFVHDVMRYTMNYQYNVTQRFIDKIPEKPVSCVKLREQYRKVSAEMGCSCSFKRTKNCYPSPVLHALSLSKDMQEGITIPTSRTLSAEKEKKVIEELNVHRKAQELAVRILELRKQQRSIEKAIRKVERELEKVYDSAEADALEIEMGLLVRRRKEEGYEWVIEI